MRVSEVSPQGVPRTSGWCAFSPGARAPEPRCRGCSSEGASGCWAGCDITVRPSQLSDHRLPPGRALLPPLGLRDPGTQEQEEDRESRPCQRVRGLAAGGRACACRCRAPHSPWRAARPGQKQGPAHITHRVSGRGSCGVTPLPALRVCGAGEATGHSARLPRPSPTLLSSQRAPGVTAPTLPQGSGRAQQAWAAQSLPSLILCPASHPATPSWPGCTSDTPLLPTADADRMPQPRG